MADKPIGDNNRPDEYEVPAATDRNRKWITPNGTKDAGGQFKNGEKIPLQETDLDRLRRDGKF